MAFVGTRRALLSGGGAKWWKAGAALDVDFAGNRTFNSLGNTVSTPGALLTMTRASTATYFNGNGVLVTASANVMRLDYAPVTHTPLGVLIEEQRTNLLTYSEQFNNAAWTVSTAPTPNDAIAPDGILSADLITRTGTTYAIYNTTGVTVSASTSYTFSFWVKFGTASAITIAAYDLTAGAFISTSITPTVVQTSSGWARYIATFTTPVGCTSLRVYADRNTNNNGTFWIWGAQLEAGAFATSYIPTTSAQVTRAADNISLATSAFSFSATEGTVSAAADAPNISTNNLGVFALGTSASVIMRYFRQTDAQPVFQVVDTTTQATLGLGATWTTSASVKSAMAYRVDDFAASKNGGAPVTATSGTVPAVAASLVFGNAAGIGYLNGHISRLTYWNTRLPNTTLQSLSSGA